MERLGGNRTLLPTPATLAYDTVVGAFLGSQILAFRNIQAMETCLMRALSRPFCPVCKQAHVLEMTTLLQLVIARLLLPARWFPVNSIGVNFSVEPLPIGPITYQWYLKWDLSVSGENLSSDIYGSPRPLRRNFNSESPGEPSY